MRVHSVMPTLIALLVLPIGVYASSNPIPGVGIVVKHCSTGGLPSLRAGGFGIQNHCKPTKRVMIPGGFFGPGSAAFDEIVPIDGRCGHACGGCDSDCSGMEDNPDGRIDYASEGVMGPFDMIMPSTVLYSRQPIMVNVDGVDTFFDVFVTISGLGALPDDPIQGRLTLPSGGTLGVGTSSQVEGSFIDLHSTMTFANASTGEAAGSAIEEDLHLEIHDPVGLPLTRVADGTAVGRIVLGLDGSNLQAFTFVSANDELALRMRSLYQFPPVPVKARTWGALKTSYR